MLTTVADFPNFDGLGRAASISSVTRNQFLTYATAEVVYKHKHLNWGSTE